MFFLTGPQRRCELLLKLSYDLHLASSRPPPPRTRPRPRGRPGLPESSRDRPGHRTAPRTL
jgi:hypothetical protein